MKQRIAISLLFVCIIFVSGCLQAEYTTSVKLTLFPEKDKQDKTLPQIVGYSYPTSYKEEVKTKEIETVSEEDDDEDDKKIVFAKFVN